MQSETMTLYNMIVYSYSSLLIYSIGRSLWVTMPCSCENWYIFHYSSYLSPVSCLQIEILSGSIVPQLPALVYHGEGDCEWSLVIKSTGSTIGTDSDGQRLPLESGIVLDLQATCVVNETLLLNATISTTGEVYSWKLAI